MIPLIAAAAAAALLGSRARADAARGSGGCGRLPPAGAWAGATSFQSGELAGLERTWLVHIPDGYRVDVPAPLVVALHGWRGTGAEYERESGLSGESDKHGFLVAYPDGMADNCDVEDGPWGSWNVAGANLSPGPQGPTCANWAGNPSYCYESCWCDGTPQCKWTTCANDITPVGVGEDGPWGFLPRLYDRLAAEFCVDLGRQYATGTSNGAMAAYQLGVSLGARLAAVVPVAGSFQRGFAQAPLVPTPVMDVHGVEDEEVPANVTMSSTGYYYTPTAEIFQGWRDANGCREGGGAELSHWPTSMDGVRGLYCVSEGGDCRAPVVRCAYSGPHGSFGTAEENARLVWGFLAHFSRGAPAQQETAAM